MIAHEYQGEGIWQLEDIAYAQEKIPLSVVSPTQRNNH
ncbi:hypothetical protein APA_256 [Pseudanabaena sp. lw0831]|nr:hypothetical protein APA_256 [Pseudanabaena sp. lw0831]